MPPRRNENRIARAVIVLGLTFGLSGTAMADGRTIIVQPWAHPDGLPASVFDGADCLPKDCV